MQMSFAVIYEIKLVAERYEVNEDIIILLLLPVGKGFRDCSGLVRNLARGSRLSCNDERLWIVELRSLVCSDWKWRRPQKVWPSCKIFSRCSDKLGVPKNKADLQFASRCFESKTLRQTSAERKWKRISNIFGIFCF